MAHIPDGFLSPPVLAGAALASAAALAVATRRSRRALEDREGPLLGALTAFVFAAQMLNFPLGAGASAHLLGGVLVAVLAGPWAAMLVLFSVLLVQALLFQDGGIAALGANTLNLAVLGAGGGWLVYRWWRALLGDGRTGRIVAAAIAAFLSTVATGVAAGAELGLSGLLPLKTAVAAVGGAHLLVGVAEAGLTAGILAVILRSRPALVRDATISAPARAATVAVTITFTIAGGVAGAAILWSSPRPDALESAMDGLGLAGAEAGSALPPVAEVLGGPWLAAAVGLAVAFTAAWLMFRMAARTGPAHTTPDDAAV